MRARWILAVVALSPLAHSQDLVKLLPDNGASGDEFGTAAIDGSLAVVGAHLANTSGPDSGTAYVFRRVGKHWFQEAQLQPSDAHGGERFGWSAAIDDHRVVVGSVGHAHVFKKLGGAWTEEAFLEPENGIRSDSRVAIDGDTIAVADYQGNAAYVFRLVNGSWTEEARLTAGAPVPMHSFGIGVAIDGDRIVVGSRYEDPKSIGAAYIYERTDDAWALVQRIVPSNGRGEDFFGWYVAIEDDTVAVGSPYANAAGTDSGCIYVFRRTGSAWLEDSILVGSQTGAGDHLSMVSLAEGRLVAGARYSDAVATDSGEAYVFAHDGAGWTEIQHLTAPDGEAGDTFGLVFDVTGTSLIVGSPLDNDLGTDSGSAYVIDLVPPLDFPAVLRGGWLAALGHRLRAAAGLPR